MRGRGRGRGQAHLMTVGQLETGDVVSGIIMIASFHARLLFDSGATNCFISSAFIIEHDIPYIDLVDSWVISTGNGSIEISRECRDCSVEIYGQRFVTRFLVYDSRVYDAILGMD